MLAAELTITAPSLSFGIFAFFFAYKSKILTAGSSVVKEAQGIVFRTVRHHNPLKVNFKAS